MLNPLIPYLLRKRRLEKQLTIEKVSQILEVDKTYLSKIENNKAIPAERKLKQLYHIYNIKLYSVDFIDFDEGFITHFLDKIYNVDVSDKDLLNLNDKISKHQSSKYLGHLYLLRWCYYSLKGLWNDEFIVEINSFISIYDLLTSDEQNFFLLCLMFYYLRLKKYDKYNEYNDMLLKIKNRKWLGLEGYIKVDYDHCIGNYVSMFYDIERAKSYLTQDNNLKRLNSLLQFEAIYYDCIGDYEKEIELYQHLTEIYLKNNQLINYGVTKQNIGSMLLDRRKYSEAIPHYIEGLKYNSLNGPYFELAWCYFNLNEKRLCKQCIKAGKHASKKAPAYDELLDWLLKMTDTPYSKSCLNLLLKIEKNYASILSKDTFNFLNIALANTYKELKEFDKACDYLKMVVNKNITTSIEIL